MRRSIACLAALVLLAACAEDEPDAQPESSPDSVRMSDSPQPSSTASAVSGQSGRIVFIREDPTLGHATIFVANADGSDVEQLFGEEAEGARWSPDGTEISLFCCDDGMAAHFLDVETGELRTLPPPDPELETFCGGPWSPDGSRMTCETFGVDNPRLNGIYSIRTSDGGDLTRITSFPGGNDRPGDYSPDGSQLVFQRNTRQGPVGIFVTNVDGTGLRRLTPENMILDESGHNGRWSPDGDQILFVAHTGEGEHKAIWVVDAEGGAPKLLPLTPACGGRVGVGGYGCYAPDWSPDGEQIVFTRSDEVIESIYVVDAAGGEPAQITDAEDDQPDWGP